MCDGPHPKGVAVHNRASFARIVVHDDLVMDPAVAKDSDGTPSRTRRPGPDDEIGFAVYRDAVLRPEFALRLNAISLLALFKDVAGLAIDDIGYKLDNRQSAHASEPFQTFDETRLKHRIKVGVDVNIRYRLDRLQLPQGTHQFGQNCFG